MNNLYNLDITLRTNLPSSSSVYKSPVEQNLISNSKSSFHYTPDMTIPRVREKNVYINPFIKLNSDILSKLPANVQRKELFNKELFGILMRSHLAREQETITIKDDDNKTNTTSNTKNIDKDKNLNKESNAQAMNELYKKKSK